MPWLSLTSTKTIRFQTVVHAPLDEVVAFLHSPLELIDLNPLVERKLVSEDDPLFYTITDKLNFWVGHSKPDSRLNSLCKKTGPTRLFALLLGPSSSMFGGRVP